MEVEEEFDILDPERLVQCPYDKHHRIRARRFPYHLVKCRKSYPQVAKELSTCPFNARHLVPQADLRDHISNCNDKRFIEEEIASEASDFQRRQMNSMSTWQAPPCDEDWDTESLEHLTSPFVHGMADYGINGTTLERKSYLPPDLRAPKSSPYAMARRASYPQVAKELSTCPFNARHLVPQADLRNHISNRNDKGSIEEEIVSEASDFQRRQMNSLSTRQAPSCDEDGDAESLKHLTSPLVPGRADYGINGTTLERKSYLPPDLRAPKSSLYAMARKASYSQVVKELSTCPFNAHHLVPQADLRNHISNCNDKGSIEEEIESLKHLTSPLVPGRADYGVNGTTLEHKNSLPPGLRVPKYSLYAEAVKADYVVSRVNSLDLYQKKVGEKVEQ